MAGGGIGLGTFSIVKGACVDIDIMFINSYFCFSEFLSIKEINRMKKNCEVAAKELSWENEEFNLLREFQAFFKK